MWNFAKQFNKKCINRVDMVFMKVKSESRKEYSSSIFSNSYLCVLQDGGRGGWGGCVLAADS